MAHGAHVLRLEGAGADLVQIDRVVVPDLGCAVREWAIGGGERALLRVRAAAEAVGQRVTISGVGLADGEHPVHVVDLETGAEPRQLVVVANGAVLDLAVSCPDAALVLER